MCVCMCHVMSVHDINIRYIVNVYYLPIEKKIMFYTFLQIKTQLFFYFERLISVEKVLFLNFLFFVVVVNNFINYLLPAAFT